MTVMTEGNIKMNFPQNVNVRRFDGPSHGLSHCSMKAIDFIVELTDRVLFIEIKDPQDPRATPQSSSKTIAEFKSGEMDEIFKLKYRDSFIYEWASDNLKKKPIHYYVLIGIDTLDKTLLLHRTNSLKTKLPVRAVSEKKWKKHIAEKCMVFNIETWNQFLPNFLVSRI